MFGPSHYHCRKGHHLSSRLSFFHFLFDFIVLSRWQQNIHSRNVELEIALNLSQGFIFVVAFWSPISFFWFFLNQFSLSTRRNYVKRDFIYFSCFKIVLCDVSYKIEQYLNGRQILITFLWSWHDQKLEAGKLVYVSMLFNEPSYQTFVQNAKKKVSRSRCRQCNFLCLILQLTNPSHLSSET